MLPVVELIRLEEHEKYGTFGVLKTGKEVFCVTLEPPNNLNAPNVSSIPAQQYICVKVQSPTFGETFEVTKVPGRSEILFHAGNTVADTAGCIILAQYFDKLKDNRAVLNSGTTFNLFLLRYKDYEKFHLTIIEVY